MSKLAMYALKSRTGLYLCTSTASGWKDRLDHDCLYSDLASVGQMQLRFDGSKIITFELVERED